MTCTNTTQSVEERLKHRWIADSLGCGFLITLGSSVKTGILRQFIETHSRGNVTAYSTSYSMVAEYHIDAKRKGAARLSQPFKASLRSVTSDSTITEVTLCRTD